jgi:hypothetical protein
MKTLIFVAVVAISFSLQAQDIQNNPESNHGNKFEQLGTILPTPNVYRTASGAPGPQYWQQRIDYNIKCELDEKNQTLTGSEIITYYNNSPDAIQYLWLQLDENQHSSVNNANYQYSSIIPKELNGSQVKKWEEARTDNGLGDKVTSVTEASGKKLSYTINKTMMRVDLPALLKHGQQYIFKVDWNYRLTNRMVYGGRGGYEYFPEDGNNLYTMTQWYPRLCVYSDFQGWQNHQFSGKEFALGFGNFKVAFTVPADNIVGATGQCQNYRQNLTPLQWSRWRQAQSATTPVDIVTLEEATTSEKNKVAQKKTWIFKADSVRDFAWTASRKFIWDAMPVYINGKKIMCMSYYPKEAYGLYHKYSTNVVVHTLKIYSSHIFPYPYPVAQSVEASNGMEYPMICFNYGRTEKNGSYTDSLKNSMIEVVIHEVGHNFFPMIINSDERQWSWMDEGIDNFFQYFAEKAWDSAFPSRRGPAMKAISYMKSPKNDLEPIMTSSENVLQFGPNVYTKVVTAMNILRETILGHDLFDYSFKEYARRWAFKHPTPADLFRTMEDASGEDLDWFWRGWFYSTEPCDLAIDTVKYLRTGSVDKYFYEVAISNKGGLVMPVIIEWTFADGTEETDRIPAQIWRYNEQHITKAFLKDKVVVKMQLDPKKETADIDESNNTWTKFGEPSKFSIKY